MNVILGKKQDQLKVADNSLEKLLSFKELVEGLNLLQPGYAIIYNIEEPMRLANILKYPLLMKYFLHDKEIVMLVGNSTSLIKTLNEINTISEECPLLIERFINNSIPIEIHGHFDERNKFLIPLSNAHNISGKMLSKLGNLLDLLASESDLVGYYCAEFIILEEDIYVISYKGLNETRLITKK